MIVSVTVEAFYHQHVFSCEGSLNCGNVGLSSHRFWEKRDVMKVLIHYNSPHVLYSKHQPDGGETLCGLGFTSDWRQPAGRVLPVAVICRAD